MTPPPENINAQQPRAHRHGGRAFAKADASALTLDTSDIRAATTLTLPAAGAVNGSAITWASSDSSIIDPATGAVTLPASGIQTVTLSATLMRGEATAYRNFDIRVWSQAELDKEAAKSEFASSSSGSAPSPRRRNTARTRT
ncbi:MAG: immunoglobulin-like domain-containing protein [Oscillospiraceae bacterium]